MRILPTCTHQHTRTDAHTRNCTYPHTQNKQKKKRRKEGLVPVQVGVVTVAKEPAVHNTVDVPDHPLVEQVNVQLLPLSTDDAEQELV